MLGRLFAYRTKSTSSDSRAVPSAALPFFSSAHLHQPHRGMHPSGKSPAEAATCITPALQAAESLLLSKLGQGGRAAELDIEYAALEELNEDVMRSRSFSDALDNRDLNRYTDVLPYNENRVRLRQGGRDYLNASLVVSAPGDMAPPWSYIVAQGPLDHTREHFWQAVHEQRCSAIVMLTNCMERSIAKCARYFPSQAATKKTFGRYTVKTVDVKEVAPDLCRRSLLVRDGPAGHKHPLDHYHFVAWPDHGVPHSPTPLLHICEELLRSRAHSSGSILVHCSAGIGRSGVFCVLDVVTRRLQLLQPDDRQGALQAVDLQALVGQMRRQRMGMVQTRDQYVFCHTALLHYIRKLDAQLQQAQQARG